MTRFTISMARGDDRRYYGTITFIGGGTPGERPFRVIARFNSATNANAFQALGRLGLRVTRTGERSSTPLGEIFRDAINAAAKHGTNQQGGTVDAGRPALIRALKTTGVKIL